jgi:hypothetical protein
MSTQLDGPALQERIVVNSSTVQEVKVGASAFNARSVVTLQTNRRIYVYFGDLDTGTPSAATVENHGITLERDDLYTFVASSSQPVYILSRSGNAQVTIAERG